MKCLSLQIASSHKQTRNGKQESVNQGNLVAIAYILHLYCPYHCMINSKYWWYMYRKNKLRCDQRLKVWLPLYYLDIIFLSTHTGSLRLRISNEHPFSFWKKYIYVFHGQASTVHVPKCKIVWHNHLPWQIIIILHDVHVIDEIKSGQRLR